MRNIVALTSKPAGAGGLAALSSGPRLIACGAIGRAFWRFAGAAAGATLMSGSMPSHWPPLFALQKGGFGLALAVEKQRMIGAPANRVTIEPRRAIVHAPQRHAPDDIFVAQEISKAWR